MLTLAIFQHLCEGFVGVHASVALFRHFFRPRVEEGSVAGSVTWARRLGRDASTFIQMELRNKWEEWRPQWCYIRFAEANDSLAAPTEPPAQSDSWDLLDERDADLAPAIARIGELHNRGLTGRHVALHYLQCAVAPLQERSHPMWAYEGASDRTRLRGVNTRRVEADLLKQFLKTLFGGEPSLAFPEGILPLHQDP